MCLCEYCGASVRSREELEEHYQTCEQAQQAAQENEGELPSATKRQEGVKS